MDDMTNIQEKFREDKIVKIKLEIINTKYLQDIEESIENYTKNCVKIEKLKEKNEHAKMIDFSIDLYQSLTKKERTRKKKIKKLNKKKKKYRRAIDFYEFVKIMEGEISPKTVIFEQNRKTYQIMLIHFDKEENAKKFKEIFFRVYPECRYNEEFSEVI